MLDFFTVDSTKDLVELQQEKTSYFKSVNSDILELKEKMAQPDYILKEKDQLTLEKLSDKRQNVARGMQLTFRT